MKFSGFAINITSADPERLIRFYRDIVGLPPHAEFNARFGGESAFLLGTTMLIIDGHSETSEQATDPTRILFDFTVEDIEAEKARLEALGVRFIREPGREFWGGLVATFPDPDGNYLQLFELPKAG